jgi:hypothetical protein
VASEGLPEGVASLGLADGLALGDADGEAEGLADGDVSEKSISRYGRFAVVVFSELDIVKVLVLLPSIPHVKRNPRRHPAFFT